MRDLIFYAVVAAVVGGGLYIQRVELSSTKAKLKACKANLEVAKSKIKAKSFETKWSEAFNYTLQQKGESNEKNGTFSDSF